MAGLTKKEKNNISQLKNKITTEILTLSKIQDLSITENQLLQLALQYVTRDQIGNYDNRMLELNKYYYSLCGILYNHLDSKQIRFGEPQTITIKTPTSVQEHPVFDEPIGVTPFTSTNTLYNDILETAF